MTSPGLGRAAREAVGRLVVAIGAAVLATLVLGGSRWLRYPFNILPVLFPIDLYGTIALLWLARTRDVLGRLRPWGRHAMLVGGLAGVVTYQLSSLRILDSPASVAYPAALLACAVASERIWLGVCVAGHVALGAWVLAAPGEAFPALFPFGPFGLLLTAAPFLVYSAILDRRSAGGALAPARSRYSILTATLVSVALWELLFFPTSLFLFLGRSDWVAH